MLSGLGPKDHLEEFGIPLVHDLNVGFNLQDHIFLDKQLVKVKPAHKPSNERDVFYNYLTKRTDLGGLGLPDTMMFINTLNRISDDYPDLQIHLIYYPAKSEKQLRQAYALQNTRPEYVEPMVEINNDWDLINFKPTLLRPKSRGRILLRSADPFDAPIIITGYLTHQDDVETLIRGMKFVEKLTRAPPLRDTTFIQTPTPRECDFFQPSTNEYYECQIRHSATTVFHPVGTCKMGSTDDNDAVVDNRLRVRGVHCLRVIDASVMPFIVSGNINIPTIMVGEKGVDMIKEDWRKNDRTCLCN